MRQSGSNVQMMHIRRLLDAVDKGEIAIPDFQRDFDWSETDVKELLVTVFAGWPAGSLLLLDARNDIFHLRNVEGGPSLSANPHFAILDGQQRLTSLYHAFFDKGESVYAVDWKPDSRPDLDERIVSYPRKVWEKRRLGDIGTQALEFVLPISMLKTASEFFEWRDAVVEQIDPETRTDEKRRLTDFYTRNLSAVHEYEFPAVVLESSLDPEAIARIFERVNRTGLKLNAFDLMVAKTYRPDWNLRDRWIETRERFPQISMYLGEDGMPLLQAIALRESADIRKSSVLALDRSTVHESWNAAGKATADAIEFLQSRCAAVRQDLVPYQASVALITALAMDGPLARIGDDLEGWFWQSAFERSFDVAANTRLVAHYRALRNGTPRRLFDEHIMIDLFSSNRKNSKAIWAAVSCILATLVLNRMKPKPNEMAIEDLEPAFLFSKKEVPSNGDNADYEFNFVDYYRSVLNAVLVPKAHVAAINRIGARETVIYAKQNNIEHIIGAQLGNSVDLIGDYKRFYSNRNSGIANFVIDRALNAEDLRFLDHTQELPF